MDHLPNGQTESQMKHNMSGSEVFGVNAADSESRTERMERVSEFQVPSVTDNLHTFSPSSKG